MANNRLWIACDACKQRILVARNWGSPEWCAWDERCHVAEFIAQHLGECWEVPRFYVEHGRDEFGHGLPELPDDYKAP